MLEGEQKKIITYHRIWFVRLIAIIVACQALKQLIGASPLWRGEYPFGLAFYTKYVRLCNLDDFISHLYCYKAHVYAEQSTVLYFVRIAVMMIILLIHTYEYRRNKKLFDKESKAVHISSMVVGIAFVCVSAFFVGKNFVIYNNYKSIYGAYAKEEHGPDAAYEDKVMNYNERAVANGDELFFFHKTENAICKVDNEGKMSTIITFDEIKKAWEVDDSEETGWLIRLDYYDGYVYFTYYLQDSYFLSRINVENGNVDEPYTDSAFYCAIKDGYLYYETPVDDDYEYFDVYRVKIESQINIDKKELYLGKFIGKTYSRAKDFYAEIIYDDDSYYLEAVYNEYGEKSIRKNGNRYLLCTDEKGKYTLKQCEKTDKKQESDETQYTTISEHVLEYNSYGDKLFYLKQENGNTELIQTDLNGNNEKVLKQYADCYESVAYTDPTYIFSIMVCEDKLVVMYEDQESNPKYDVVGY